MLWYLVTAVISASAGVFCMGMWCSASIQRMRGQRDIATSAYDAAYTNYATERRKRLEAEEVQEETHRVLTAVSEDLNTANARIENVITLIDSIPHRNGNETRIKAMLRGEA